MENVLSRGKEILFTAIVIACVLAILRILYNTGYSVYMQSSFYNDWMVWEKLGYKIYYSKVLKVAGKVFFYSGLVAVYAMWKKPRPTWMFVLIVLAALLPLLESKTMYSNFQAWDYMLAYNIIHVVLWLIWTIAKWIIIAKLYTDAEKYAKSVLALYMIIFGIGIAGSLMIYSYTLVTNQFFNIAYPYTINAINILLYVMTIVYLKKKLGENMPFTNAVRFIKKECTNREPVD